MLIAPAVFLRRGFFCPKPDIGNKIHSRACRAKAALPENCGGFLMRDSEPGGSGFAPPLSKFAPLASPLHR